MVVALLTYRMSRFDGSHMPQVLQDVAFLATVAVLFPLLLLWLGLMIDRTSRAWLIGPDGKKSTQVAECASIVVAVEPSAHTLRRQ